MNRFFDHIASLFHKHPPRDVALVLGGGGAKGFAHIGAIESLLDHGYNITSVAGTSMGALVGGLFACGKLEELKETVMSLNRRKILSLIDISPGLNHVATADRLSSLLASMTGDINIEQLPIPFCCVASDIAGGKEYVFDKGPLVRAIRSSISLPGIFSPIHIGDHVLVDGSVHNTLPLDRVARHKGDILVAVNASAPDDPALRKQPVKRDKLSSNVLTMAERVCEIAIQNNTLMAIRLTPPDILVDIPMNSYGLLEFEKGKEIIEYGRRLMDEKIQK